MDHAVAIPNGGYAGVVGSCFWVTGITRRGRWSAGEGTTGSLHDNKVMMAEG